MANNPYPLTPAPPYGRPSDRPLRAGSALRRTIAIAHKHARRRAAPDAPSWAIAQAGGSSCHPDSDERFRRKRSCGPVGRRCRCRIRKLGASFPLIPSVRRSTPSGAKRASTPVGAGARMRAKRRPAPPLGDALRVLARCGGSANSDPIRRGRFRGNPAISYGRRETAPPGEQLPRSLHCRGGGSWCNALAVSPTTRSSFATAT